MMRALAAKMDDGALFRRKRSLKMSSQDNMKTPKISQEVVPTVARTPSQKEV